VARCVTIGTGVGASVGRGLIGRLGRGRWSPLARAGGAVAVGRRIGAGAVHAGGAEDLVDDVSLLAARVGVERHRLGNGAQLLAFFAFEYGPLELLLCSHQCHLTRLRPP